MKKVLAIVLTLAVLSAASVTAFAASPIIAKGGSDAFDVTGTYVAVSYTHLPEGDCKGERL